MQEVADRAHDAVIENDIALQSGAAQVKVTVFEAHHFIHGALFVDVKRRRLGGVQNDHLVGDHFQVARRHGGIAQILRPCSHRAFDLQHKLDARLTCGGMRGRRPVSVDGDLHQAAAVA